MAKVVYEKRDRIGYVTLNRPEALNALDDELNDALWDVWADFQRGRFGRCRHRDGGREGLLLRGRPENVHPEVGARHHARRAEERGEGDRGRNHQGAAPDHEADHRGRQRFRDRGRVRAGARVRHPHRLGEGEVRGVRGEAGAAPGRRGDRPARRHRRGRHRSRSDTDGAGGFRGGGVPAGAGEQGRAARGAVADGRALGADDPRQRAAGDPVRQGDDPRGHRPPAGRRAEAGNRQRIFERRGFPRGRGEAAEIPRRT